MKYVCELCGLVYDEEVGLPAKGIAPGTAFQDLPADFECPGCYSERSAFYKPDQKQELPTPDSGAEFQPDEVKLTSDR